MLPKGESEPVALPKSGGFIGSPPLDPLKEYVTLMVLACADGAAQKLKVKRQTAADRKVFGFTVYFLSVPASIASEPMHVSTSKKLVVKPL
jgi:hypothetical protein